MNRSYDQLWDERSKLVTDKTYGYQKAFDPTCKPVENTFSKNAIKGIHSKNLLNQVFFSESNLQKIQNLIRYNVYKLSNNEFKIGEQDYTQIQIVMRSVYLQYGRNLNTDISGQIQQLNNIVADELAPKIVSNIKQYVKYLKDIAEPYKLIERPQNMSNAGLKSLRIDTALGFGNEDKSDLYFQKK